MSWWCWRYLRYRWTSCITTIYHDIDLIIVLVIVVVLPDPEGTFCFSFNNRFVRVIVFERLIHIGMNRFIILLRFYCTLIKRFFAAPEQSRAWSGDNRVTGFFAPQFWLGWFRTCRRSSWFWTVRTSATSLRPRRSPSQSSCPNCRSTKTQRVSASAAV